MAADTRVISRDLPIGVKLYSFQQLGISSVRMRFEGGEIVTARLGLAEARY